MSLVTDSSINKLIVFQYHFNKDLLTAIQISNLNRESLVIFFISTEPERNDHDSTRLSKQLEVEYDLRRFNSKKFN